MPSPQEHRLYEIILKQVLWDEDEQKIRKRLQVNEVPEEEAEAIYQAALRERVSTLRIRAKDNFSKGLVAFIVGAAVLIGFWLRLKALHPSVIAGSGIFLGAGSVLMLMGALAYLAAPNKKGSVADN